ncbi:uncharacterized protein LOC143228960 isoform X3 [Tachypleus tridentatus]|uniref:uncharacterized protein LOC143228960 isoform X3 n=1 Tax=Tachypleus tridentatus TaxID=6853 RepID=UPI003FD2CA03
MMSIPLLFRVVPKSSLLAMKARKFEPWQSTLGLVDVLHWGQKPSISDTKPAADVFKPDEGPYLERHVRPEVSCMYQIKN